MSHHGPVGNIALSSVAAKPQNVDFCETKTKVQYLKSFARSSTTLRKFVLRSGDLRKLACCYFLTKSGRTKMTITNELCGITANANQKMKVVGSGNDVKYKCEGIEERNRFALRNRDQMWKVMRSQVRKANPFDVREKACVQELLSNSQLLFRMCSSCKRGQ